MRNSQWRAVITQSLRNLTVTSNSDQIHCDYPGKDGLLFHIPLQLGGEKG